MDIRQGAVLRHVKLDAGLTIFMKYCVVHFETCRNWRYSLGLIVCYIVLWPPVSAVLKLRILFSVVYLFSG